MGSGEVATIADNLLLFRAWVHANRTSICYANDSSSLEACLRWQSGFQLKFLNNLLAALLCEQEEKCGGNAALRTAIRVLSPFTDALEAIKVQATAHP